MEKLNAVLVVLNENSFETTLNHLDFDRINLVAILTENGNGKVLTLGDAQIPGLSFSSIRILLNSDANFFWLLSGKSKDGGDLLKMKNFLMHVGVPEENIVNFDITISRKWLANLRHIEEHGADFFSTGISSAESSVQMNFLPMRTGGGIFLGDSTQDLRQSYLTAKHVFEHVEPGTIKFVLIGLAPHSLRYDNSKDFGACSHNLQYMLALDTPAQNHQDQLLLYFVGDNFKNIFATVTAEHANLDVNHVSFSQSPALPAEVLIDWEDTLKNLTGNFNPEIVAENFQILKDYIKLCLDNGAKPVGVVFPFATVIHDDCNKEFLTLFRAAIRQLSESYDFMCVDLFDLALDYDCFRDLTHLNFFGSAICNSLLSFRLYEKNLIALEQLCDMKYDYFNLLTTLIPKDDYNALFERVLEKSVEVIRSKDKIKVGFLAENAANWCGDKLYNYFAEDDRFEPTIFLCMRADDRNEEIEQDFLHGIEQFKARGLNVVGLPEQDSPVPTQDIMFFLKPYLGSFPIDGVQFYTLTPHTLLIYIPYGFNTSMHDTFNTPVIHVAWKIFLESKTNLELFKENCTIGAPRGFYSGYPRLDSLFENKLTFKWKSARRKAKKIIWAPHWSINRGITYATFQWNYKFMYEFAKAHPEISWVVKPHPKLPFTAVETGLFPSVEAYREYLQAWNDLPNAQVYTGAYYQAIFATSDGMIMDCGSFIAEYQYTHKPMIFLTRDTQQFNALGEELMEVLYRVDGQDLDGIAALMKKIFIQGKDDMFKARKKFFDKHLNYPKYNGMSASEFIFRNIVASLEEKN